MSALSQPTSETDAARLIVGWERERDTERAKAYIRWFAIPILFGMMLHIRSHDAQVLARTPTSLVYGLVIAGIVLAALETAYLWRPGLEEIPPAFKFVSIGLDIAFLSVLIHYTGFTQSPYFFVYFVVLISNCLRYGLGVSLYVALMFNVLYAVTLGLAPPGEVKPSVLGGEGLKILAFWATAFYGGSVSARLRRQANQLRVYEETILGLRAQLRRNAHSNSESE